MKKTMFKLFALVLAVLLPLSAMAGVENDFRNAQKEAGKTVLHRVEFVPDPVLSVMAGLEEDVIGDLAKVLAFENYYKGEGENQFSVLLKNEALLNIVSGKDKEGNVVFAVPELDNFAVKVPAMYMQSQRAKLNWESMLNPPSTGNAKLDEAVANLLKKAVIEDVTEANDAFDQAAKRVSITMENDDVVAFIEAGAESMPQEAKEQAIKLYKEGALTIAMTQVIHAQEDGTVVAMDMNMKTTADQEKMNKILAEAGEKEKEETENALAKNKTVDVVFHYARKTAEAVNHNVKLSVKADDENGADYEGVLAEAANGFTLEGKGNITAEGNPVDITTQGNLEWKENKAEGKVAIALQNAKDTDNKVEITAGIAKELADNTLTSTYDLSGSMQGNTLHVGAVKITESYVDAKEIPSVADLKAYDVNELNEKTVQEITERIATPAQSLIFKALGNLPESIVKLIMGGTVE